MTETVKRRLQIINVKGLHARASAKMAETCERFNARATIIRDGMTAGGDSIMGLLMLAAAKGTWIEVETTGEEAVALADAIEHLVGDYFGEGM